MRTTMFRTDPVQVDDATYGNVVCLKDFDGAEEVTVYVENMDVAAALEMRTGGDDDGFVTHGSKNGNLKFTAVSKGTGGNNITVKITAAPNQAFSIGVVSTAITINLKCDAAGQPFQKASEIMDLCNANGPMAALVTTSLATGSDGSATMQIRGSANNAVSDATVVIPTTNLKGGKSTAASGAATVEHSPLGAPTFPGPWDESSAASTAFSSLSANSVAAFKIDTPVRGFRITIKKASSDAYIVVTAIARKKGGL